jgi:ribonuclease P protein component
VLNKINARSLTHFTRSEIKSLISRARVVSKSEGLHIKAAPKLYPYARILIVISRKVGNAVTRNKIRRRIRHIFMTNNLQNSQKDSIVYVLPAAKNMSYTQLLEQIVGALNHDHTKNS